MKVGLFDFDLPEERIALHPVFPRDSAKMLVVGEDGGLSDCIVTDLEAMLNPGDVLVVNDTRVIPAELRGTRYRGEFAASISFNLHKRIDGSTWLAFARPAKRLKAGDRVVFATSSGAVALDDLSATITTVEDGQATLVFDRSDTILDEAIKARGAMPLPPYIGAKRDIEERDKTDYQTVYAAHDGAVAAPTAGLHFTPELLDRLKAKGIAIARVTLHVGAGTFLPMKVDDTENHTMHAEWGVVSPETVAQINEARAGGGRVVAVGTTSLRLLESAARKTGTLEPFAGETDIFITPGYRFNVVDVLMTNFHLPRSTLFMLVSAFSGLETMHKAYKHAIESHYRFYSYGDSSLLFRADT